MYNMQYVCMYSFWCMRLSRRFSLRFSSLWCGRCLYKKKTAFSLHTDQIDVTVAFILEIAIEQTFVLKCQRKCHYRNLPYMLAPLPSPHSTSSSLFKLSPLPKQNDFFGFRSVSVRPHTRTPFCLFRRIFLSLAERVEHKPSTDGAVFQATSVGG